MVHLEDFRGRNVLESIRSVSQGRKNVDGNMQRITKMAKLLRNSIASPQIIHLKATQTNQYEHRPSE